MAVVAELVNRQLDTFKFTAASGPVPIGVAGSLRQRLKLPLIELKKYRDQLKKIGQIRLSVAPTITQYFTESLIAGIKHDFDVTMVISEIDYTTGLEGLKKQNPDVYFGHWVGGFNDPDGFIAVIVKDIGMTIPEYTKTFGSLYKSARSEGNWSKRSELYREFANGIMNDSIMIPGWKVDVYGVSKLFINYTASGFRYTPRWTDARLLAEPK
jgi:ABC-type oligopeptide transport system substrate-binding subunit